MEGKLKYKGQLDKDLVEWLSPRGIKPDRGIFSDEDKQEYKKIEGSDPEGEKIINQTPEGAIYNIVDVKLLDEITGPKLKVDGTLCG